MESPGPIFIDGNEILDWSDRVGDPYFSIWILSPPLTIGCSKSIDDEFRFYGKYIYNLHIKDRVKFGKTVRLGNGNADFIKLFKNLEKIKYTKNLILQTARSNNNRDIEEIKINLDYLKKFHNA